MFSTLSLWAIIIILTELFLVTSIYQLFAVTLSMILLISLYMANIGLELLGVSLIIAFTSSYLVYILIAMYLNSLFLKIYNSIFFKQVVFYGSLLVSAYVIHFLTTWYGGRFEEILIRNDMTIDLYTESTSITMLIHLLFFKVYILFFLIINVFIFFALAFFLSWVGIIIFDYARFFKKKKIGSNTLHKRSWRKKSSSVLR